MDMPLRQPSSLRSHPALPWISWKYSLIFAVAVIALIATVVVKVVSGSPSPEIAFRVIDSTGAPVANAAITLGDLHRTTDSNGEASIPTTDGQHTLSITSEGQAAVSGSIDPSDGSKREITLQSEVSAAVVDPETPPAQETATVAAVVNRQTTPAENATALATPDNAAVNLDGNLISGKILDAANAPIQGARVGSGGKWVITGKDGIFQLNRAEVDAAAPLRVFAAGYLDQDLPVPAAGTALNVKLELFAVKGIYYNPNISNTQADVDRLINLIDTTELNAIVIDVKEEIVYYDTKVQLFNDSGTVNPVLDLPTLLKTLKAHNIYTIARQVVFKDGLVAEKNPELAVKSTETGKAWRDMNDVAWVNPTNESLWKANADMAVELAHLGFDEIQYDYVRFPTDGDLSTMDFGVDYNQKNREAAINGFLEMSHAMLIPTGAKLSADIFGYTMLVDDDLGIGQNISELYKHVDFVSPMVYPSHYGESALGYSPPNDYPFEIIEISMAQAKKRMNGNTLAIRPWLQDFSFPKMTPYGAKEVRAQIDATEQGGGSGWLLWDPNNKYTVGALHPAEGNTGTSDIASKPVPVAFRNESTAGKQRARLRSAVA